MSIEEIVVKGTKPKTGDEYYSRAMMGGSNIYAGGREPSKYQIVERGVAPPIENNLDFLDEVEVDTASINPGNVRYQGQMFDEFGDLVKDVGEGVVDAGKGLYKTAANTSKALVNTPVIGDVYRHAVGGFSGTPGGLTGRMAANMIPPLKAVYNDFGFAEGGPVNASMYDTIDISETIIDENEKDFQKRKMIERLREKFDPEKKMSDADVLLKFRKTLEEPGFGNREETIRKYRESNPYPPISPFEEPDPDEDYGSNWYDSLTDEEKARIDKQNKPYRDRNRMLKPEIYDGPMEQLAHGGQVRRRVPDIYFNKYEEGGEVYEPRIAERAPYFNLPDYETGEYDDIKLSRLRNVFTKLLPDYKEVQYKGGSQAAKNFISNMANFAGEVGLTPFKFADMFLEFATGESPIDSFNLYMDRPERVYPDSPAVSQNNSFNVERKNYHEEFPLEEFKEYDTMKYRQQYNMGGAVNNPSTMGIQSLTPSLTTHSVPGSPQTNAVNTNDPRFSNNSVNPITALASGIGNLNKSTNTTNALLKRNSTNPNTNPNANLKINYTPNPTTKENRFAFFNALNSTRPSLG